MKGGLLHMCIALLLLVSLVFTLTGCGSQPSAFQLLIEKNSAEKDVATQTAYSPTHQQGTARDLTIEVIQAEKYSWTSWIAVVLPVGEDSHVLIYFEDDTCTRLDTFNQVPSCKNQDLYAPTGNMLVNMWSQLRLADSEVQVLDGITVQGQTATVDFSVTVAIANIEMSLPSQQFLALYELELDGQGSIIIIQK